MKLFIKKILQKILVISMITVFLSFFSVSSVAEAKISLEESEFYYTGTQNSEVMWEATLWQKIVKKLKEIANFLIGLMFMAIRSVFVGWIEIFEIILTLLLGEDLEFEDYMQASLAGIDTYSQRVVNIERIIFNEIGLFDIDMFGSDTGATTGAAAGIEAATGQTTTSRNEKILRVMRESVAKWYVTLRLIVVALMLLLLIFIGIKMAIATVASEKAVYKQMLIDWVTGIIIIFSIHYIMAFIVQVNNTIVESLGRADTEVEMQDPYEFGDVGRAKKSKTPSEIEFTLYESARTRAYSMSPLDGFAGMIIYGALVYYAWKFALIYLRRLLNIMILTLVSPIIAGTYAFNKTLSGGASIYSNWLKEYIINVIIQVFHAIIYLTLVSTAFELALESLLGVALAIVLLSFMSTFGQLLRQLFNVSGGSGSLFEEMAAHTDFKSLKGAIRSIPGAVVGGAIGKQALKLTGRVATKPIRKAAEVGFGKVMKVKANSKRYKEKKAKKEAKARELYDEYNNSEGVVSRRNELESQEEALFNKKEKIQKEKKDLKEQLDIAQKNGDQQKVDDLTKQLEAKEKEEEDNERDIQKNQIEINDFEDSVQAEFLDYYVRSQSSWETIKENVFDVLLDPEKYLDKDEVTFDQIEEKASEMFKDYDKYKEIVKNKGRTKEEAEMYKEYSEMKGILGKRKALLKAQKSLDGEKQKLDLEKVDLQRQLDEAVQNNEADKIKDLRKQIAEKEKEIHENEVALNQNQDELSELEEEAVKKYEEYFSDYKVNKEAIKNDINIVFNKIDERVEELEEKLNEGGEDKEDKRRENLQEAYEKLEDMRSEAKDALVKYKLKKTKREGGVEYAFWRKKESGIGKTFFDNAKLDKILGLSSDEKKILKKEFDDTKSMLLGVASGIAGVALLGGNASVGMALLANNVNSRLNSYAKMATLKSSPSRLKYNYKFKAFGEGSKKTINAGMEREIQFAESKMTKINVQKHPVLKKVFDATDIVVKPIVRGATVFSGVALGAHVSGGGLFARDEQPYDSIPEHHYTRSLVGIGTLASDKLDDVYQKKARKIIKEARKELVDLNTKTFESEYKSESRKYKQKLAEDVKNESTEDLILEEILASDNVIKVGDNTIIEYVDPDEPKIEFKDPYMAKAEDGKHNTSDVKFGQKELRAQRLEAVIDSITENKTKCIQIAIFDIAMAKKITDIEALSIDDRDRAAIRQNIKERYERKGHLRKGELKINKIIEDKDINEALNKLTSGRKKSNNKIADMMVKKACFGYMTQNNMTDPNMLSSSQAKSDIEAMIANGLMSKASRSTQDVLNQMGGGNQPQSSNIPDTLFSIDNIGNRVDEASKKMKKRTVQQVSVSVGNKLTRQQLVEISIIRRENEMKTNLESAVYTGDDTQVSDDAQLRMLFLLSEIGNQNKEAYKVEGKRAKKTKEETLGEMRYQQSKTDPDKYAFYDEEEPMPREADLNVLLHGRRDIIDIINNG